MQRCKGAFSLTRREKYDMMQTGGFAGTLTNPRSAVPPSEKTEKAMQKQQILLIRL